MLQTHLDTKRTILISRLPDFDSLDPKVNAPEASRESHHFSGDSQMAIKESTLKISYSQIGIQETYVLSRKSKMVEKASFHVN